MIGAPRMIWNDTAFMNMNPWTFHEPGGHFGALTKNPERRQETIAEAPRGTSYRTSATSAGARVEGSL